MKYKLSELKHRCDLLGVFGIEFLPYVKADYTNAIDLCAKQWIAGAEIKHKIQALTFEEALATLLARAEHVKAAIEGIKIDPFEVPDIGRRNMFGHLTDGNVEFVGDIQINRSNDEKP